VREVEERVCVGERMRDSSPGKIAGPIPRRSIGQEYGRGDAAVPAVRVLRQ